MLCPNCKIDIPADSKHCPNCGTKVVLTPEAEHTQRHIPDNQNVPEPDPTDASFNAMSEDENQITDNQNTGRSSKHKLHKFPITSLLSSLIFIIVVFLLYQNFFKSNSPEYPENPHEFTSEQISSLEVYDLSEINSMRSRKLDGRWIIVTGVHSFNASDDTSLMMPALSAGSSTISRIYYYSDKDFASAYLALPLDETTVLGRCSYKDGKYSIVDAILLKNDTHQPLLSTNTNSQETYNGEFTNGFADNSYDISVTGNELVSAAEENTARVINMYSGKRLKISNLEITYISADSAYFDGIQSIYFRDNKDLQSINKGDKITIIGYIEEDFGTYCINDAVLVSDTSTLDFLVEDSPSPSDDIDVATSESPEVADPYEVGKQAAQKVYSTIFQYGYDCEKIAIICNSEDPVALAMADGFYDEAVLAIGYTPYDVSVYAPGITDYTVFLTQWKNQGIEGVYIPFTSQSEFDFVFPILAVQAETFMCNICFFNAEGNDIT